MKNGTVKLATLAVGFAAVMLLCGCNTQKASSIHLAKGKETSLPIAPRPEQHPGQSTTSTARADLRGDEEAVRLKPNDADAHLILGSAYAKLGRLQDAIPEYNEAIRLRPNFAAAHYNLGIALGNLGRFADAEVEFKQVIRLTPDFTEAHYGLGAVYGKTGRPKDAVPEFKEAIRLSPDSAQAHYGLGLAYSDLGNMAAASEEYNILKKLDAALADMLNKRINS